MRALTVRNPWAWAIVHGGKDVENRSRNIAGSYRGTVAIHAGLALDLVALLHWSITPGMRDLVPSDKDCVTGAVIGVAELVDVHHATQCRAVGPLDPDDDHHCSRWAMPGHHHLVLVDARPLREPVPARGRLGLWTPDAGTIDAIIQAVAS